MIALCHLLSKVHATLQSKAHKTRLFTHRHLLTSIPLLFSVLTGCQSLPVQTGNSSDPSTVEKLASASKAPHPTAAEQPAESPKDPSNIIKHEKYRLQTTQSPKYIESVQPAIKTPLVYTSVWQELSDHFQLAEQYKGKYDGYVKLFLKNKPYFTRVSKRAKPYLYHILQEVKKRKMPYEVALLPAVESGFSPTAKSYQSAAGLWQFIPGTAHMYDLHKNWWYDGRMDIIHSTNAALNYLQKLYQLNNNDWLLALASYNAGPGNVYKAQKKYRKRHPGKKADFWAIRKYLPKETQHYVPQLFAIAYLVKHRDQYQIALEEVPNESFIEVVPLKQQVSLKKVREITGVSEKLMKRLNPCYLRPTTPPNGKHHLLLPKKNAERFKQKLAEDESLFKVQWAKHKVRPGESLSTVAHKYHTSIREIKRINHLHSNLLRAGKTLLIPYPKHYADKLPKLMEQKYNGKKYFHTVKRGESIWTIANYYNISTKTLCRWNNIGIRTPLWVGQKLEIRSGRYGKKITHKLKKGENLWAVAQRYGTTSTQLAKWNRIKRNKILQPGDQLIVWIPKQSPSKSNKKEKQTEAKAETDHLDKQQKIKLKS